MCFGPVASLTASGFLGVIGTFVLKNIRRNNEVLIGLFPMIFAIQQLIEGFLWLALMHGKSEALIRGLTVAFLIFAYAVWPILCPLSVYLIEYDEKRKKTLEICTILGTIVSLYLLFFVIKNHPAATIANHSIQYNASVTGAYLFGSLYILITILPYFISSQRNILVFGIPNILLCVIAFFIYQFAFISVWCFFAALISASLYFFLKTLHGDPLLPIVPKKIVI